MVPPVSQVGLVGKYKSGMIKFLLILLSYFLWFNCALVVAGFCKEHVFRPAHLIPRLDSPLRIKEIGQTVTSSQRCHGAKTQQWLASCGNGQVQRQQSSKAVW